MRLWDRDGSVYDLGTLGGDWGDAIQINNKGQVGVGFSATATNPNGDPFLWEKGVFTDLGNFAGDSYGQALDINDKGQVVGWSAFDPGDETTYHALLWENGEMTKSPDEDSCQLPAGRCLRRPASMRKVRSSARGYTTVSSAPSC